MTCRIERAMSIYQEKLGIICKYIAHWVKTCMPTQVSSAKSDLTFFSKKNVISVVEPAKQVSGG
jgi:hypothetical protein